MHQQRIWYSQVESILAATIYHSADHYYCDTFMGYITPSEFLQSDMTYLKTLLIPPNTYKSRKLLCRQHLYDPICKVLYDSAREFDPVFAETALFLGIAS